MIPVYLPSKEIYFENSDKDILPNKHTLQISQPYNTSG
jgi:hypothetical protein